MDTAVYVNRGDSLILTEDVTVFVRDTDTLALDDVVLVLTRDTEVLALSVLRALDVIVDLDVCVRRGVGVPVLDNLDDIELVVELDMETELDPETELESELDPDPELEADDDVDTETDADDDSLSDDEYEEVPEDVFVDVLVGVADQLIGIDAYPDAVFVTVYERVPNGLLESVGVPVELLDVLIDLDPVTDIDDVFEDVGVPLDNVDAVIVLVLRGVPVFVTVDVLLLVFAEDELTDSDAFDVKDEVLVTL